LVSSNRDGFIDELTKSLTNQHLVLMGDSIMRQQYLSLTFLLRNKPYTDINVHQHSESNGWYKHFVYTNEQLKPYEFCDCYRDNGYNYDIYCENRYYFDPIHNISVTYLQYFGKDLFGHWFDPDDYDSFREPRTVPFKVLWRLSIQDTIRNMLSKCKQKVTFLMINFDHWEFSPHRKPFVWSKEVSDAVYKASVSLLDLGPIPLSLSDENSKNAMESRSLAPVRKLIWKTATQAREDFSSSHNSSTLEARDHYMCSQPFVTCFNLSWTVHVPTESFVDHIHFKEDIADIINLQLLYDVLK